MFESWLNYCSANLENQFIECDGHTLAQKQQKHHACTKCPIHLIAVDKKNIIIFPFNTRLSKDQNNKYGFIMSDTRHQCSLQSITRSVFHVRVLYTRINNTTNTHSFNIIQNAIRGSRFGMRGFGAVSIGVQCCTCCVCVYAWTLTLLSLRMIGIARVQPLDDGDEDDRHWVIAEIQFIPV